MIRARLGVRYSHQWMIRLINGEALLQLLHRQMRIRLLKVIIDLESTMSNIFSLELRESTSFRAKESISEGDN